VRFVATALLFCAALTAEQAAGHVLDPGHRVDGSICVDAATGAVLTANRGQSGSPASVTKLMTLLLVLEDIRDGKTTLRNRVGVTQEAEPATTRRLQVWLGRRRDVFDGGHALRPSC
jgi:D-alanyl-D-alanine carboxypeptidase